MGFLNRFKNARDASTGRSTMLPLIGPTPLRIPEAQNLYSRTHPLGPSLPIFVFDPALIIGDGWDTVLKLGDTARIVDALPIDDPGAIATPLREQIAQDPYFGASLERVTDEFVTQWISVGQRLGAAEASLGISRAPQKIDSATSAALTLTTLDLDSSPVALLAQLLVRDGYLFDRVQLSGGPEAALWTKTPSPDFRLFLARHLGDGTEVDMIEAWTSRLPLRSQDRGDLFASLVNACSGFRPGRPAIPGESIEELFVADILSTMRRFAHMASKMRGRSDEG